MFEWATVILPMKKYELFGKGERIVPFTPKEMDKIEKEFPDHEKPLHYVFRSGLRYNKETQDAGIVAISPHFVKLFDQNRFGETPKLKGSFHILDVELIAFSEEEFILVKTRESNLICTARAAVRFAQLLYRNYSLSMNRLDDKYDLEVRCSNLDLFPDIDLYVSPSQKFQFAYFAFSSYYEQPYRHDVVRYMHSLICSTNPVIDLTRFPRGVFIDTDRIRPLVKTLELVRYSLGICCEDMECPNLMDLLLPLQDEENGLRLVHLKNCGIETGFKAIKEKVEEDGSIHVGYWNLNGNPCSDFGYFARVIELTFSPVYFLGISYTDLDVKTLANIFNAMANNTYFWELKELQIAGLPIRDEAFDEFAAFLDRLNKKKQNRLESIDIGRVDGSIVDVFNLVIDQIPNLSVLAMPDNKIGGDLLGMLTSYIRESNVLRSLDISGSSLDPNSVAEVILAFEDNTDLTDVTLKLGRLDLNGTNLLPLFRAFLTGDKLSDQKWKGLNFDSNEMTSADLRNLIPLFEQFPNLSDLSLAGNFSRTTPGPFLGEVLTELVGLKQLRKLNIAGDSTHKIGTDMTPMLSKLKLDCQLTDLDISNNEIGDGAFAVVVQLVGRSLERISLDGNAIRSIDMLMDFCLAVKKNERMISVGFPANDGDAIARMGKGREREILEQRLGDIQISVATYVTSHRRKRNLPNELPFEPSKEVLEMLNNLSGDFAAKLKGQNLYQHTCFSDEFGIPMPFQKLGEASRDIQRRQQIPIGDLEVYETESMKWIVREDKTVNDGLVLPSRVDLPPEKTPDPGSPHRKRRRHKKPEEPPKPKIRGLQTVLLSDDKLDDLDQKRRDATVPVQKKSEKEPPKKRSVVLSSSSEEDEPRQSKRKRSVILSSSSSDEEPRKSRKSTQKKRPPRLSSSSEDEEPRNNRRQTQKKRSYRLSSSSDDDQPRASKRISQKKSSRRVSSSSDDEPRNSRRAIQRPDRDSKRSPPRMSRRRTDYSDDNDDFGPRKRSGQKQKRQSFESDEDSLIGWRERSERKRQQMNQGSPLRRPANDPGRSEFDAPSSISSGDYNRPLRRGGDAQPQKSSVRKAAAPVLSPSMKPVSPNRASDSSDEELVALPKGSSRLQRRRIELNSALDDTPPLTMARVPVSHLFDKD